MSGAPTHTSARYLPIAEHGLIGDLRTAALVGTDGTIDGYCTTTVAFWRRWLQQFRYRAAGGRWCTAPPSP